MHCALWLCISLSQQSHDKQSIGSLPLHLTLGGSGLIATQLSLTTSLPDSVSLLHTPQTRVCACVQTQVPQCAAQKGGQDLAATLGLTHLSSHSTAPVCVPRVPIGHITSSALYDNPRAGLGYNLCLSKGKSCECVGDIQGSLEGSWVKVVQVKPGVPRFKPSTFPLPPATTSLHTQMHTHAMSDTFAPCPLPSTPLRFNQTMLLGVRG